MYLILFTSLIMPVFLFTNTVWAMYSITKDYVLMFFGKQYPNTEVFSII